MLNVVKLEYLTTNFIKNCKFSFKFCPPSGDFVEKFCHGVGVFERKFSGPEVSLGEGELVTGQGDTFMLITYYWCMYSRDFNT